MTEANISVSQDQFSCPVCLDLLKDPVTVPCGHSYCMRCIADCWDQEDQTGIYSCPQCRQTFSPRPVLGKNTTMAEMVEKLKKTKLAAAGPGDVECDVCIKIKCKAVKSCLVCLNSYCQNHLEQHESLFKVKHSLMDANGKLQEMICLEHNKLLEVYCRTDQQCICMTCIMDQHGKHETVKAAAERTEKQKPLEQTLTVFKQKINQRMKELEELRVGVEEHKCSAKSAVESSEMMFTELIHSIERSRSEVTQLIRDQEKAAVLKAEEYFVRLEQEIDDLRRKEAAVQELLHTDDHVHFLQSFQSLCAPPETSDLPSLTVSSVLTFDHVGESVSQLRTNFEDLCKEEIKKIADRVRGTQIITIPDPKTREELLQDFCPLTLVEEMPVNHLLDEASKDVFLKFELKTPSPNDENKFMRDYLDLVAAVEENKSTKMKELVGGPTSFSKGKKMIRKSQDIFQTLDRIKHLGSSKPAATVLTPADLFAPPQSPFEREFFRKSKKLGRHVIHGDFS